MKTIELGVIALLSGTVGESLHAGVIQTSPTQDLGTSGLSTTVSFQPFDTLGGTRTLTGVSLAVDGALAADYFVQNPYAIPADVQVSLKSDVTITLPAGLGGGALTPTVQPQIAYTLTGLGAGQEQTLTGLSGTGTYTFSFDPSALSFFLSGMPSFGLSGLLSAGGDTVTTGNGKGVLFMHSDPSLTAQVELTYDYAVSVPESTTTALIAGLGLVGFAGWRRPSRSF
jgi:hypothetical protein